jgi:hypothetical protein
VSAIEKIEERFEAVRQAAFDGADSSIAIWPVQFRAALAEAWEQGRDAGFDTGNEYGQGHEFPVSTDNPYREGSPS